MVKILKTKKARISKYGKDAKVQLIAQTRFFVEIRTKNPDGTYESLRELVSSSHLKPAARIYRNPY